MNWLILNDYLKRWFAFYIILGYGGISIVYARYEVTDLFPMLSSLAMGLYCFYFWMDTHLHSTVRFHRSLPVQRDVYARTVWIEGVLTPVLIAIAIYVFGAALSIILFSINSNLFQYFPKCLIAWLFFSSSFYTAYTAYRERERGLFGFIIFTLTIVICFCLYAALLINWNRPFIKEIFTGASVILAFISFQRAARFINLHPGQVKETDKIQYRQDFSQQEMSISLIERIRANLFLSIALDSFILIALTSILISLENFLYEQRGAYILICAFLGVLMILFFVMRWISFLSSMKLFISLPISRKKLFFSLIALPGVILLPVAFLELTGFHVPFHYYLPRQYPIVYLLLYSSTLLTNAVYLRYGPLAVALTINIIGVFMGLLSYKSHELPGFKQFFIQYHIYSILLLIMTIFSIYWTYHLLYKSSDPYREKPSFGNI